MVASFLKAEMDYLIEIALYMLKYPIKIVVE